MPDDPVFENKPARTQGCRSVLSLRACSASARALDGRSEISLRLALHQGHGDGGCSAKVARRRPGSEFALRPARPDRPPFIAPGYPLLIALVFRIFGTYTFASSMVIITVQILLNLGTVWLMMHVTRMLFGHGAAWIAGLVWACSLPLIWIPTIFWGYVDRHLPVRWPAGAGCFASANELPRWAVDISRSLLRHNRSHQSRHAANARSHVRLAGLSATLRARALRHPARRTYFLRGLFALADPQRKGLPCIHSTCAQPSASSLWMGNRPGATGFLDESLFPSFNPAELQDYKTRGELSYTAHKSDLAKTIYSRASRDVRPAYCWSASPAIGWAPELNMARRSSPCTQR